jgi:arylsulfatase A-like enzyme
MNRRSFIQTSGGAALSAAAPAASVRPNILLILGDNQQWGTIADRSQCRTPHINRLAEQGVNFTRAYTNAAVCSPARNALLTGSFNWKFGTYNHPDSPSAVSNDLAPDAVTYAMRLKEAGYRCGYNGKYHSSVVRIPTELGYSDIGAPNRYRDEAAKKLARLGMANIRPEGKRTPARTISWPGSQPWGLWGYTEGEEDQTELHAVADGGIAMMKRYARESQPWIVEVHFPEAFRAWPLRRYRERYDPKAIPVAPNFRDAFENKPGMQRREAMTYGRMTESDYREGRAFYYASFEQMDAQVGRILRALDETGQTDRTLVVFAADHGAPWGAHHMWMPCFAPYEETYRIPMVMRWPGRIQAGSTCDRLAQFHDLAHTFIDVTGAAKLPHSHGLSLRPLMENPARPAWRDMIQCSWYGQNFLLNHFITTTPRYKYAFNAYDFDECYDLQEDPGELRNVANSGQHADIVADMQARTYELMRAHGNPFGDGGGDSRFHAQRYLPQGKRLGR